MAALISLHKHGQVLSALMSAISVPVIDSRHFGPITVCAWVSTESFLEIVIVIVCLIFIAFTFWMFNFILGKELNLYFVSMILCLIRVSQKDK